jgi:NitT/TauT family transport system permease protein
MAGLIGTMGFGQTRSPAKTIHPAIHRLVGILVVLALWQVWSSLGGDGYYISTPFAVAAQLSAWVQDGSIWGYILSTLENTLAGFLLAAVAAVSCALLFASFRFLERVFDPFIFIAFSTPKVIVAPLLILLVGIGNPPVVALSFVSAFFLIFFNAQSGLSNVPAAYLNTAAILGAGKLATAIKFRLPAAAPFVATGLHQGLIYAFHGAILGEMTASNNGLGYLIVYSATSADSTAVIAGLTVVGAISFLLIYTLKISISRGTISSGQMEPAV